MVGGEEREGKMYGKSNMEIYNTICKIDSQWEFAVWLRELKQGLCDNLEGRDGEGDGRDIQKKGDMGVPMTKSWCMTENHKILQSKYPSIKKLKWQKIVPFTKGIKYLEINLTKEVKDLESEIIRHCWKKLKKTPKKKKKGKIFCAHELEELTLSSVHVA